jgi:hypothetical protein
MTGTTAAPRRYQRDWVLACRDATSFYSTPLAWDLSGPLDPQLVAGALAGSVEVSVPLLREGTDVDLPALPAVPDEPGNEPPGQPEPRLGRGRGPGHRPGPGAGQRRWPPLPAGR